MTKSALLLLFLASSAVAAEPAPPVKSKDIAESASRLDRQSKAELGVGVLALSLLVQAEPGTYLLKEELDADGTWSKFKQLEKAGYVTISVTDGLPDGSNRGQQFAAIRLTASGKKLRDVLVRA